MINRSQLLYRCPCEHFAQIVLTPEWGSGQTSSSDGQAFQIAFKKPVMSNVNAKYGRDPVSLIYTTCRTAMRPFTPRPSVPPSATPRTCLMVCSIMVRISRLKSIIRILQAIRSIFLALCHLLGFRFAPRIRDLRDHRLFSFEKPSAYTELRPLIAGRIHTATIRRHWDEVARLATSIRQGSSSASLLVGKLAAYPRQTPVASALREIGRIERTLFTLTWLQDPELRRRVTIGLNKGEGSV
jgi:TnpA family transposase